MDSTIRPAIQDDLGEIMELIRELASFAKLEDEVIATHELLEEALFGAHANAEAIVSEMADGSLAGYAIFFHNFSTFQGRRGLYLEDLYIRPQHRGQGIGKSFLKFLANLALKRGCGRFEWCVLSWNQKAIEFYTGLGAEIVPDGRIVRLDESGIRQLSSQQ